MDKVSSAAPSAFLKQTSAKLVVRIVEILLRSRSRSLYDSTIHQPCYRCTNNRSYPVNVPVNWEEQPGYHRPHRSSRIHRSTREGTTGQNIRYDDQTYSKTSNLR